jgi:hypothetical protein
MTPTERLLAAERNARLEIEQHRILQAIHQTSYSPTSLQARHDHVESDWKPASGYGTHSALFLEKEAPAPYWPSNCVKWTCCVGWTLLLLALVGMFAWYLHEDGRGMNAWTVGGNEHGQLGDESTTTRKTPALMALSAAGNQDVAAGNGHTVLLRLDGSVWTVGLNDNGQLGDGGVTSRSTAAPMVLVGKGNLQVAAGRYHTICLQTDGSVWTVGSNTFGQLVPPHPPAPPAFRCLPLPAPNPQRNFVLAASYLIRGMGET